MKILTVQELANTAKDSWKRQYFYNGFGNMVIIRKLYMRILSLLEKTQHLAKLMRLLEIIVGQGWGVLCATKRLIQLLFFRVMIVVSTFVRNV